MPTTRHRFSCGHKGKGAQCHRCAHANALEAKADKTKKPSEAQAMKQEAARLRTLDGKFSPSSDEFPESA